APCEEEAQPAASASESAKRKRGAGQSLFFMRRSGFHAASNVDLDAGFVRNGSFLITTDPLVELDDGQAHVEARASPLGARGRDLAAVRLGEFFDEREADAESAVSSRGGAVGLPEAIPDVRHEVGGYALARVLDL